MAIQPVRVTGLREFQRSLKQLDANLPKALRVGLNQAVQIVVDDARPKVPTRTGRAAASIKVSSTQTKARVKAGGARAPYMPWLDFGGKRKGRGGGIAVRQFRKKGRYIWLSLGRKHSDVIKELNKVLQDLARRAGLSVTQIHG